MIYEILSNIKWVFVGMVDFINTKVVMSLLSPLGVFLFGINHVVILKALICLVVIDFITGSWSARESGEVISSRKASRSAYKLVVYGLLAAGSHLTELILPGGTYLEEIVISFLALTEMISILENVGKAGFAIPHKLLKKLQVYRDEQ